MKHKGHNSERICAITIEMAESNERRLLGNLLLLGVLEDDESLHSSFDDEIDLALGLVNNSLHSRREGCLGVEG